MIAKIKRLVLWIHGSFTHSYICSTSASTSDSDKLGGDTDNSIDSYQQGNSDGKSAGLDDYPYRNND